MKKIRNLFKINEIKARFSFFDLVIFLHVKDNEVINFSFGIKTSKAFPKTVEAFGYLKNKGDTLNVISEGIILEAEDIINVIQNSHDLAVVQKRDGIIYVIQKEK